MRLALASGWSWETGARAWTSRHQSFSSRQQTNLNRFNGAEVLTRLFGEVRDFIQKKFGARDVEEMSALAGEADPEMFFAGLLSFGQRLQDQGKPEAAAEVYSAIVGAVHEPPQGTDHVSKAIGNLANTRLNALLGKGSTGLRAEILIKNFAAASTDSNMIIPMLAGSVVAQTVRAATLGRLVGSTRVSWLTRGIGARFTAGFAGYAAEVPVFAMTGRLLSGSQGSTLSSDLQRAAVTLGALKIFAYGGNQAFRKLHGFNELGLPLRLSTMAKFNRVFLLQSSIFLGLLSAHRLEEYAGLRPRVDGATTVTDTLASMVSMGVGMRLGQGLAGPGFLNYQIELNRRTEIHSKSPAPLATSRNLEPPAFVAGFGLPMMAGLGWLNWLVARLRRNASAKALPEAPASTALVPVKEKPGRLTLWAWISSLGRKFSKPRPPTDLDQLKSLRKAQGWEFPALPESTYQSYVRLAQARGWPLEMVMARALKTAPMEEVESWMERLFPGDRLKREDQPYPGDLSKRVEWIRQGKIRGGWKLLLDSLRVPGYPYRGRLLFETIRDLQVQELLPELYALLQENLENDPNNSNRMEIFRTILSIEKKERALEFLDQQLQEPWLNGPIDYYSWTRKHRRRVLRLRARLNLEMTGDNAAALNEILKGESWKSVVRHLGDWHESKRIRKNIELFIRMGDPGILLDVYNRYNKYNKPAYPLYPPDNMALVAALVDQGKIAEVQAALSEYRTKLLGDFQFGYTEQAKILANAGEKQVALEYLRRVLAREGCKDRDRFEVLEALLSMGESEGALEMAQKLLHSPEVAFRAAELMDQIQPGWDDFLRRPVPLLEAPYR